MLKQQSGFTLIELIAVLVILGILAATAVPRFINLSDEAQEAATRSIAGSISSASALNHAVDIAVEAGLSTDSFINVTNCNNAGLLLSGGLPAGYTVNDLAVGDQVVETGCLLSPPATSSGTPQNFTMIGASNT